MVKAFLVPVIGAVIGALVGLMINLTVVLNMDYFAGFFDLRPVLVAVGAIIGFWVARVMVGRAKKSKGTEEMKK